LIQCDQTDPGWRERREGERRRRRRRRRWVRGDDGGWDPHPSGPDLDAGKVGLGVASPECKLKRRVSK
jgi:hypothetical protein